MFQFKIVFTITETFRSLFVQPSSPLQWKLFYNVCQVTCNKLAISLKISCLILNRSVIQQYDNLILKSTNKFQIFVNLTFKIFSGYLAFASPRKSSGPTTEEQSSGRSGRSLLAGTSFLHGRNQVTLIIYLRNYLGIS